ncbi:MAG: rhomboid family intramembrane serine protease [Patescibacteria group bacterium]|mgnify:CR=1 FL=1
MNIPWTNWKLSFNAPITLIIVFASLGVMIAETIFGNAVVSLLSASNSLNFINPFFYLGLLTHPITHNGWSHFLSNVPFLLLLGPLLEEKYGFKKLLLIILLTTILTGILNALFFSTALCGASGIVFLFIMLSSFANVKAKEVPLTFLLIAGLYIGQEIINSLKPDHVSQFAHILGGACGSIFGFVCNRKQ